MRDGEVRVSVEDTGPGVPNGIKKRLFARFERGLGHGRGEGLGLFIVRTLVTRYGGEVRVDDRSAGRLHTEVSRVKPPLHPHIKAMPLPPGVASGFVETIRNDEGDRDRWKNLSPGVPPPSPGEVTMPESVYCEHCGREILTERQATIGDVPYCSAECLTAAGEQDAGRGGRRPERFLVSGRSPWGEGS